MTPAQYKFINWYFSSSSKVLDNEIDYNKNMIAHFICESFDASDLGRCSANTLHLERFNPSCSNIVIAKELNKIIYTIKDNTELFYNVLVHGSYSSNDYSVGWSDLDALVILKSAVFSDHNKLLQARELIMQCIDCLRVIDPLCHHEFQIITEKSLCEFKTNWLPLSVIEKAHSILSPKIVFGFSDSIGDSVGTIINFTKTLKAACNSGYLDHHSWKGEFLHDNYKNHQNGMYQLKYLLSVIVLMPALYFTAKGSSLTKPEAIQLMKKEMPLVDYELIDKATAIRLKWPTQESHPYATNSIPKWLMDDLGGDYFSRSYKFVRLIKDALVL